MEMQQAPWVLLSFLLFSSLPPLKELEKIEVVSCTRKDGLNISPSLSQSFLLAPGRFGRRPFPGNLSEGPGLGIIAPSLIEEPEEGSQLPRRVKSWDRPVVEIQHLAVFIMLGAALGVYERKRQLDGIKRRYHQRA